MPSTSKRNLILKVASAFTLGWSERPSGKQWLRMACRRLVLLVLRARGRTMDFRTLGSVVVIAPHPDDETFGCGGAVALLARAGVGLHLAVITDGSASHPDHPSMGRLELATLRRTECMKASESLGNPWRNIAFLGAPDGDLPRLDAERRDATGKRLVAVLRDAAAAVVLIPCRRDGSSEHEAAFKIAQEAIGASGMRVRLLEYPVWSWWNPLLLLVPALSAQRVWHVDISDVRELKSRAVACYASQLKPLPPDSTPALPSGFGDGFLGRDEFFLEN